MGKNTAGVTIRNNINLGNAGFFSWYKLERIVEIIATERKRLKKYLNMKSKKYLYLVVLFNVSAVDFTNSATHSSFTETSTTASCARGSYTKCNYHKWNQTKNNLIDEAVRWVRLLATLEHFSSLFSSF